MKKTVGKNAVERPRVQIVVGEEPPAVIDGGGGAEAEGTGAEGTGAVSCKGEKRRTSTTYGSLGALLRRGSQVTGYLH